MWNLKYDTNRLIYIQKQSIFIGIENKLIVTKGESGCGRDKLGVWDQQTQTTIYKINNKVLLCSTGNYIQYAVINHNGKEYEKEYIIELFCCTPETNTTL